MQLLTQHFIELFSEVLGTLLRILVNILLIFLDFSMDFLLKFTKTVKLFLIFPDVFGSGQDITQN